MEEKGSNVNLATWMLVDAFENDSGLLGASQFPDRLIVGNRTLQRPGTW